MILLISGLIWWSTVGVGLTGVVVAIRARRHGACARLVVIGSALFLVWSYANSRIIESESASEGLLLVGLNLMLLSGIAKTVVEDRLFPHLVLSLKSEEKS